MAYTKGNMFYKDYSWTAYGSDDPRVSGEPDNSLLSRKEGYEMLYFINTCAKKWNWTGSSLVPYHKLEKMIRTILPSDVRSQMAVYNWIVANYKEYWDKL